jgi:murein DD-endopeptidase MepM/ murein hydrolase activator NlpD
MPRGNDLDALIRKAAHQAGVPERLFASLIKNGERSWKGWQTSPAGAQGPAQLMPGTAAGLSKKYGINTSTYYGNLLGGAYYLAEQLRTFGGNSRKAVAAYNAGPGNIQRGVYPEETQRYIKNVLGGLAPGNPRQGGSLVAPVSHAPLSPIVGNNGTRTVAGPPTLTLRSAAPPDITPLLTEGLGRIAQGWDPTEILKETTPSLLESWLQPSTLVSTPTKLQVPQIGAPPVIQTPQTVTRAGRVLHGLTLPIAGKMIGTPADHQARALGNWESDNAVDIAAPVGTPIYAVADGVIGPQFGALGSSDPRMQGLRLHLISRGNEFYYAHLSKFAPGLQPGQRVRKGQLIGYSGTANGVNHLHFATEKGSPVGYTKR